PSTLPLCSLLFFFLLLPPPPTSTLFPYTTLFRSRSHRLECFCRSRGRRSRVRARTGGGARRGNHRLSALLLPAFRFRHPYAHVRDRKSTRLNSSHLVISYAVFCLKKKKKTYTSSH